MSTRTHKSGGSALLESILGIALLSLYAVMLIGTIEYVQIQSLKKTMRAEALFHAEEGIEAVRSMRNQGFTELQTGPHGLTEAGGHWEFAGTGDSTGEFARVITISQTDTGTVEVISRVTWGLRMQAGDVALFATLTDWQNAP